MAFETADGQRLSWAGDFANIVAPQGTRVAGKTTVPIGAAAPLGPAQLTYRGGPLIAQVKAFTLYWGSAWGTVTAAAPGAQPVAVTRQTLDAFFGDLVAGAYIDLFAEYTVPGYTITRGSYLGSVVIGPDPGAQVADADIQAQIQQRLAAGTIPARDSNTLYLVMLPSGTVVQEGGSLSCQTFCGYHDAILDASGNPLAYYGVLPYPDCVGCASAADGTSLSQFDALTTVSSHEVAEAITDPVPGSGWYDDANGEIGDICAWQTAPLDGYVVQQEWSNAANSCVGPTAG